MYVNCKLYGYQCWMDSRADQIKKSRPFCEASVQGFRLLGIIDESIFTTPIASLPTHSTHQWLAGSQHAPYRLFVKTNYTALASSPTLMNDFVQGTRDMVAGKFQVPTTPANLPVGNGSSYVFIINVYASRFPGDSVPAHNIWTAVDMDICSSNAFAQTSSYIDPNNPNFW